MENIDATFLTPDEVIETLREKVTDPDLNPAKMALTVGDLRNLLDRVKSGKFGLAQIKAAIVNMLKLYGEHNPSGDGLPMPFIWTRLKDGEPSITNLMVEQALTELLKEKEIHAKREGLTFYRYGRDPEEAE